MKMGERENGGNFASLGAKRRLHFASLGAKHRLHFASLGEAVYHIAVRRYIIDINLLHYCNKIEVIALSDVRHGGVCVLI